MDVANTLLKWSMGSRSWLCIPADSGRIPTEVSQKAPSGKF